jgi:hypothetical protein
MQAVSAFFLFLFSLADLLFLVIDDFLAATSLSSPR